MSTLRFAFRSLSKSPGFFVVAVLTLALGIGANVLIFAYVDSIVLRPLPFRSAERLVIVTKEYPGAGQQHIRCSLANYYDWRSGIPAFASTSAINEGSVIVGTEGAPVRISAARVTSDFFATLGLKPALGRFFTEAEMDDVRSDSVVLTDSFWRRRLNADPDVLGKEILVDGRTRIVVGVLPGDFTYLSSKATLFFPQSSRLEDRSVERRHQGSVQIIARLAPGASIETAEAQLRALDERQIDDHPFAAKLRAAGFHTSVTSLQADHVRSVRPTLLLLQAGALALLVIGVANLANLFIIRASVRAKEQAVRQALGAGFGDVVSDALSGSLLLSGLGALFGIGAGGLGIKLFSLFGGDALPLGMQVSLDVRVATVALLGSLLLGLALAVPVIWYNLHQRLDLHSGSRGATVGRTAQRLRQGFIVAQIALAFMLLSGACLLGVSLQRVLSVSPGFQPERTLSGRIDLPNSRYRSDSSRSAFCGRLLEELRAQPGINAAALSTYAPFSPGSHINQSVVAVEGSEVLTVADAVRAHFHVFVQGDYWSTLGIPLRSGRLLDEADQKSGRSVCVVDEAFARRYWPAGDAVGHRLSSSTSFVEADAVTIVGIVGNVRMNELGEGPALGTIYFPYDMRPEGSLQILVRTDMDPAVLASLLRDAVKRLDPGLPVEDILPMEQRIENSLFQRRSSVSLSSLFAAAALTLASIGTYGVLSYAVAQRRREFGIRLALGAQRRDVLLMVLSGGFRLVALGLALGLAGFFALADFLKALLFGVSSQDPRIFGAIAIVMLAATGLACLLPAFRATQVDPAESLRAE